MNLGRSRGWRQYWGLGRLPEISSVKAVIQDSSMPLQEIVGMAGRGRTPPDSDSSSVESPSVGCGRVGLGRMPTASD